jgi:undecaprenyl-diphosphatase
LGIFVVLLPLNGIECNIVLAAQNLTQTTVVLQVFPILTYLGDFYVWVILASIYMFYAYFKSRKQLDSAIELACFLIITTALTYFIKIVFARPRPDCPGITAYDEDLISSFSYPSGHVSRAVGAFMILSRGSRTKESLATIAITVVSISRIILGVHYLTDIIGAIFLSLAAQKLASLSFLLLNVKWKKGRAQTGDF